MRSLLLALFTGVVGGALLHIIIILALPSWTGSDAFSRVVALGETQQFFTLANEANVTGLFNDDPHLRSAVCRFDLQEAPLRITARGVVALWTLAIYDRHSDEVYSMNDRAAIGDGVDMILGTTAQMLKLRRNMPEALQRSIFVELENPEGFVVLRTIVPDPSSERQARGFLSEARCQPLALG
ncbi:DUF1254 domain-containing protein [Pseudohoeflea sp. DP4N28-3]|uniref:DUF1254 domain-containing protein n=1 Tax=Pseudohoeflea coraliihabitans TaxID=2860393 RepID=A0ABS6WRP5_9HYPH|nr:DUF1254 domain-containing protein [Pseudohoeflea sp. DP4N28-3]